MTAYQFNGKYYDPDLAQLGDGASAGTAYGFREGNWRVNLSRFFGDFTAHIAGLVTSSINGSNIFGHEALSSGSGFTLTNSNKRSLALTHTAGGQATKMPNATTIVKGEVWRIRHLTNAAALQNNSGGVLVASLGVSDEVDVWCEDNSTAAGVWRTNVRSALARTLLGGVSSAAMRTTLELDPLLVGRNRIINGAMRIDQRKEGAVSASISGTSLYTLDRWIGGATGAGAFTVQRLSTTPPAGFTHYAHIAVGTADASLAGTDVYVFGQRIEGNNAVDLLFGSASAKTIILSFWVRSNLTGAFSGVVQNSAGNRTYAFPFTINAANTWEFKTITVPGDTTGTWLTDNGVGIGLFFCLGAASGQLITASAWAGSGGSGATGSTNAMASTSNTFDLAGVQVEAQAFAGVATPFEWRDVTRELLLCQRYFRKSHDEGVVPAVNAGGIGAHGYCKNAMGLHLSGYFPVRMRGTPTMTAFAIFSGGGTSAGGTLFGGSAAMSSISGTTERFLWTSSGNTNADDIYAIAYTADAEL